jgi:hypothetical protein
MEATARAAPDGRQDGAHRVVEGVVVLVVVVNLARARLAVRIKDVVDPGVGLQRHPEGVQGRIFDLEGAPGANDQEHLVAFHQPAHEAAVDTGLARVAPVGVNRGVEGIVRLGDVVGQNGGVELDLIPLLGTKGLLQFQAVGAHLPGQRALLVQLLTPELAHRLVVVAGKLAKRVAAVVVEVDVAVVWQRRVFAPLAGVLAEVGQAEAVGLEEGAQRVGQRLHRTDDDQPVRPVFPGGRRLGGA